MKGIDAYPLTWPEGWGRTSWGSRRRSDYKDPGERCAKCGHLPEVVLTPREIRACLKARKP